MSGKKGGGTSPETQKLQQLQIEEYAQVKAVEARKKKQLERARFGGQSLMSGLSTGVAPAKVMSTKQTLVSL
jgi:hypothetical protein